MSTAPRLPEALFGHIEHQLDAHPDGMREHDLIRVLRSAGFFAFLPPPPADPRLLFRAHFLLFHALYLLADRLAGARRGLLQIGPLCIRRLPWRAGEAALTPADGLRDYYLDWRNLDGMTEAGVQRLLDAFWNRCGRVGDRERALAELGLVDPVSDAVIKQAWRRLAMMHHPDRGGDEARLQAINHAADRLLGRP